MASILYKDGETIRVPYERLKSNLAAGWSTTPDGPKPAADDSAELEAARELYAEKFGKKAHHKMTVDTILAKLGEADD